MYDEYMIYNPAEMGWLSCAGLKERFLLLSQGMQADRKYLLFANVRRKPKIARDASRWRGGDGLNKQGGPAIPAGHRPDAEHIS
jgi:hypothetical protein